VEEWFHGHNYLQQVPPESWDEQPSRVVANTERCLELLARHAVRATFFVLGWTAQRHPQLVRSIAQAGHEIGCHGYSHPVLFRLTDAEFLADLDQATEALRAAGIERIDGYRAPSFSLTPPVHHFLHLLAARGYRYDCSLFPVRHPRYGQPGAPRRAFALAGAPGDLVVVPMTTIRLAGGNWPFSGGGYLRMLPLSAYRLLRRLAGRQKIPVIVYLHPWELDSYRPDVRMGRLNRWRSQGGQDTMPGKLEAILATGNFRTLGEYVRECRHRGLPQRQLPLTGGALDRSR
jgi:polysaccharide deacetylase family protein (PEP-CTERM system associated)